MLFGWERASCPRFLCLCIALLSKEFQEKDGVPFAVIAANKKQNLFIKNMDSKKRKMCVDDIDKMTVAKPVTI